MLNLDASLAGTRRMRDKFFLDTNIFLYTFDSDEQAKQQVANQIIKSVLVSGHGCTSSQVVQEFINVATRKFKKPLSIPDCEKFVRDIMSPLCRVFTNVDLCLKALEITDRWRFAFYDSLIIAAAQKAKCNILYSEDMQHKQKVQNLTIYNPFIEAPSIKM